MSLDMQARGSRRAILGAALGAVAASVAQAIGRPIPVRAGADGDVVVGLENRAAAQTSILIDNAESPTNAFFGWTYGTGAGVHAVSLRGTGLFAESRSATKAGLISTATATSTGIIGASLGEAGVVPTAPPATGVHGFADDGTGVRGETLTTTGIGGQFIAPTGGTGLSVRGKAKFERSGSANVAAGKSSVDVAVTGGLASSSLVLATIQALRPGVAIAGVAKNVPSAGKVRIYLTKTVGTSTPVAWFVVS